MPADVQVEGVFGNKRSKLGFGLVSRVISIALGGIFLLFLPLFLAGMAFRSMKEAAGVEDGDTRPSIQLGA